MASLDISIPETQQQYIEQRAAEAGCSPAEYVKQLIEADQKLAAQQRLEALLLEGLDSGEPIEVTDEWWAQLRERVRQRYQQRHEGKEAG